MNNKDGLTKNELNLNKVLKTQKESLEEIAETLLEENTLLSKNISSSEEIIKSFGYNIPLKTNKQIISNEKKIITIRTWEEIVNEATKKHPENIVLSAK